MYRKVKRKQYPKWSFRKMNTELFSETLEWKYTDAPVHNTVEEAAR